MSLLFGKARLTYSQSSSSNFYNQTIHEKSINDRDVNSFEGNDRQVILVGHNSSGNPSNVPSNIGRQGQSPSNFTTPSSRPSRNVPGLNPYRVASKIVDKGFGVGGNPAGAENGGGNAEFDDQSLEKQQSQESETFDYDYRSNDPQNKKKSKDQCPIDPPEVNESFKSDSSLKKVNKRVLGNQDVKREYRRSLKRIGEGVDLVDIGRSSTDLGDRLMYVLGRHGHYIIKNDNGVKDIVGITYRGSRNDMKTLAKEMNKLYNVNIEPGDY